MHLLLWASIWISLSDALHVSAVHIDIRVRTFSFAPWEDMIQKSYLRQSHSSLESQRRELNAIQGQQGLSFFSDNEGKSYFLYKNRSLGNFWIFDSNDLSRRKVSQVWIQEKDNYGKSAIKRSSEMATKSGIGISAIKIGNDSEVGMGIQDQSEALNRMGDLAPPSRSRPHDDQLFGGSRTKMASWAPNEEGTNASDSIAFNYAKKKKSKTNRNVLPVDVEWKSQFGVKIEPGMRPKGVREHHQQMALESIMSFLCVRNHSKLLYISEIDTKKKNNLSVWRFDSALGEWREEGHATNELPPTAGKVISFSCQTKLFQAIILFHKSQSEESNFSRKLFTSSVNEANENLMKTYRKREPKFPGDKMGLQKGDFVLWKLTLAGSWISTEIPAKISGSVSALPSSFTSEDVSLLQRRYWRNNDNKYRVINIGKDGRSEFSRTFPGPPSILAAVLLDPEHVLMILSEKSCTILRIQNIYKIYISVEEKICPKLNFENSLIKLQNVTFLNPEALRWGATTPGYEDNNPAPEKFRIYSINAKEVEKSPFPMGTFARSLRQEEISPSTPNFATSQQLLNLSSTLLTKNPTMEISSATGAKHPSLWGEEGLEESKNKKFYFRKRNKTRTGLKPGEEISPKINNAQQSKNLNNSNRNGTQIWNGTQKSDSVLFFSLSLSIFAFVGIVIFVRRCVRCPPPDMNEMAMPPVDDVKPPSPIHTLYNNVPDNSLQIPRFPFIFKSGGSAPNLNMDGDLVSISSRECMTSPELQFNNSNNITPDTPKSPYTPKSCFASLNNSQILTRFTFSINSCENSPRTKSFSELNERGSTVVDIYSDSVVGSPWESPRTREDLNNARNSENASANNDSYFNFVPWTPSPLDLSNTFSFECSSSPITPEITLPPITPEITLQKETHDDNKQTNSK